MELGTQSAEGSTTRFSAIADTVFAFFFDNFNFSIWWRTYLETQIISIVTASYLETQIISIVTVSAKATSQLFKNKIVVHFLQN